MTIYFLRLIKSAILFNERKIIPNIIYIITPLFPNLRMQTKQAHHLNFL